VLETSGRLDNGIALDLRLVKITGAGAYKIFLHQAKESVHAVPSNIPTATQEMCNTLSSARQECCWLDYSLAILSRTSRTPSQGGFQYGRLF